MTDKNRIRVVHKKLFSISQKPSPSWIRVQLLILSASMKTNNDSMTYNGYHWGHSWVHSQRLPTMTTQRSPICSVKNFWQAHEVCISLASLHSCSYADLGVRARTSKYNIPLLLNGVVTTTFSEHRHQRPEHLLPSLHHHCKYLYPLWINSSVCS